MSGSKNSSEAKNRAEDIRDTNKENEAKRILQKKWVTDEEIEEVFGIYGEMDLFNEYLVNGAIITCDQSTKKQKDVTRDGKTLVSFSVPDSEIEVKNKMVDNDKVLGKLTVTQTKRAKTGEEKHATTVDYCFGRNIPSFGNCKDERYDEQEIEKLLNEGVRDVEHGTCKYLICIDDEWEDEDLLKSPLKFDTRAGMKDGLTMTSMLFCSRGGWIFPVTSGQSDYSMDKAFEYMELYLEGRLSEAQIEKVISFCMFVLPQIAQFNEPPDDERQNRVWQYAGQDDKFDMYIKAWTYFWNRKIEEGTFGDVRIEIRPEVVKAMIVDESEWGTGTNKNGGRDVMQSLYPGDYSLWLLSGYNPLETKKDGSPMYHPGKDKDNYLIWAKDGVAYVEPSMIWNEYYYWSDLEKTITSTEDAGFDDGLGILRDNIITVIAPPYSNSVPDGFREAEGEYLLYYDKITPNMSIACGIGYLAYCMEETGSEEEAVRSYNGGGREGKTGETDAYVKDINEILNELNLNGQPVKELQK